MSIAAISSRVGTSRITLSRCFSQCSSVLGEPSSSGGSSSTSSSTQREPESRVPLYQNSKAASRPRANARSPLYARGAIKKRQTDGRVNTKGSPSSQRGEASGDASYIAALNTPAALSSDELRQLYARLDKQQSQKNVLDCLTICKLIKRKLRDLSLDGTVIKPPIYVYEMLLKRLSHVGDYDLCLRVVKDMKDTGFEIDMTVLNHLLKAAVQQGDQALIEDALSEISAYNGSIDPYNSQPSSNEQPATILSEQTTRNWTPATYQHLLHRCYLSHNPEYALLLIGSASYRQKKGGDELSFLSDVLTHDTVADIVKLLAHVREARLAVEIGQWFNDAVAARKLSVQSWMTILRCCADQLYLPGIKIAWEHAVEQGLVTPDDGLVIGVLNAAAREGETAFVQRIQYYHRLRLAQANLSLQECHLVPLFEAYCKNKDYYRAIQSIVNAARITSTNYTTKSLISLKFQAASSREDLEAAYDAFLAAGRNSSPQGGVSVVVLNTLIQAANRLNDSAMTFKLYRSRNLVRNESSPPDAPLPRLPRVQSDEIEERKMSSDDVEQVDTEADTREDAWTRKKSNVNQYAIQADVETYNEVLFAALGIRNYQIGQVIFRQFNAAKMQGNQRTYEVGIRLELIKDDYQGAFKLLEECKKRNLVPSMWTYLKLAKRCLGEDDPRWVMVAREMMENGYRLGNVLFRAMQQGNHLTDEEINTFKE
jgi:pentatricopeptide repeat protein